MDEQLPKTLDEALLREISDQSIPILQTTPGSELFMLHFSPGQWIRNRFQLWNENRALVEALGCFHPDSASDKIIRVVWERLQNEE
jgi:hypothetical protein